jgi:EmrB/QacA subfamily drug resistance transporter
MKEGRAGPSCALRLRDALLSGYEPAPAKFVLRLSYYPWLVVGTTCIGAFIGQVDASIVQLALPTFERVFDARLSEVTWVALAYLLAIASILPVFARLAEITGRKLMYLSGFALFTLASALCGLAMDLTQLIALRVLQGIGGAMLGANSIVILVSAAGPSRRGRAMGIYAAAQAVGVSVGPAIGGLLLGVFGWRWVFWVNVPFGLAGAIIGWVVLPRTTDLSPDRRFDWRGALLLTPALTSLFIVLSESQAWGPMSPALITIAVAAVVLLSSFAWQEHKTAAPLIDLDLFRLPAFSGGCLAVVLSYAMLYGMFFLMSFAFVRGYHDPPLAAGVRLAVIPVALGAVAPFSGALYERLGPRIVTVTGMVICVAALILLSMVVTRTSANLAGVMVALAVFGVGLGVFIAPNNSSTMGAAPTDRAGEAGGLLNLMRISGTSVGVAAASSVLAWRLEVLTGMGDRTLAASEQALLGAVNDGLVMLVAFAVIAGSALLLRTHRGPGQTAVPERLDFDEESSRQS